MIIYSSEDNASIAYLSYDNLDTNCLFDTDALLNIVKTIHSIDFDEE